MPVERESQMLQAAKLYYELELTQAAIARRMNVTRWTVGRLLREAREAGIVRIDIVPTAGRRTDLETELQRHFGLQDAIVVPRGTTGDERMVRDQLARAGAEYLGTLQPDLVAVSWGRTMAALADHVEAGWHPGVRVVMMNGSTSRTTTPVNGSRVAEGLATAGPGTAELLPVPAVLGERKTREALERDPVVGEVLNLAREAQVSVCSLGAMSVASVLVESGYIAAIDVQRLAALGAVGDIIGRFIGADSRPVDADLDGRTLALTVDEIAAKPHRIIVAGGLEKVAVIRAALVGGLCSTLITDDGAALGLLTDVALEETS